MTESGNISKHHERRLNTVLAKLETLENTIDGAPRIREKLTKAKGILIDALRDIEKITEPF